MFRLIEVELFAQEAEKVGLTASEQDVEKLFEDGRLIVLGVRQETRGWTFKDNKFDRTLLTSLVQNQFKTTLKRFVEIERRELLAEAMRRRLCPGQIDDKCAAVLASHAKQRCQAARDSGRITINYELLTYGAGAEAQRAAFRLCEDLAAPASAPTAAPAPSPAPASAPEAKTPSAAPAVCGGRTGGDPARAESLNKLAQAAMKKSDFSGAATYWAQAIEANPALESAYGDLSFAYLRAGRHQECITAAEKCVACVQADRIKGACLYNKGVCHEKAGDKAGAAAAYQASLRYRDNATVRKALEDLKQ